MGRISVQDQTKQPPNIRRLISAVLRKALRDIRQPSAEVTILLTTDGVIQKLNRRFRKINRPTDVLSFANEDAGSMFLGDIAISIPTTKAHAAEQGIPFEQELTLLVIHGLLHLLGYDHATPKEKKEMFTLQAKLLRRTIHLA